MPVLINCPACDASISNEAESCPRCGQPIALQAHRTPIFRPVKKKRNPLTVGCLAILGVIFGLWILGSIGNNLQRGNSNVRSQLDQNSSQPTPESPRDIALHMVKLDFNWSKGGFGNVMLADFTISNPSDYSIKDIEITCEHSAPSGTEIDSNTRTVYQTVPAKGKKVIRNFNMGWIHTQAARSSCKVVDLVVQ